MGLCQISSWRAARGGVEQRRAGHMQVTCGSRDHISDNLATYFRNTFQGEEVRGVLEIVLPKIS